MNKEELLAASGIQYSKLPDIGVELRTHGMDYPFLLENVFTRANPQSAFDDFKHMFFHLTYQYMEGWIKKQEQKKDFEKDLMGLYAFQAEHISFLERVFEKIFKGGNDRDGIPIPVSNARILIRRFGKCLGLRLLSNNGASGVHENGSKILETICQNPKSYLRQFIHSVECIIPLYSNRANPKTISFSGLNYKLKTDCPHFNWMTENQFTETIISQYINPSEDTIDTGICWGKTGLKFSIKLLHYQNRPETKVLQWRKGNIEKHSEGTYKFINSDDLCLSISIAGAFPQSTTFVSELDIKVETINQQNEMLKLGAALYYQLCAMLALNS